jgi:hypothetical protein
MKIIKHMADSSLIKKYDVAGLRYTSYPTVPHWQTDTFDLQQWQNNLVETFSATNNDSGINQYIMAKKNVPYMNVDERFLRQTIISKLA